MSTTLVATPKNVAKPLRVAVVGPLPPPYGGVSVHVQRLTRALDARGLAVSVFPEVHAGSAASVRWLRSVAAEADVIHYHTFETGYRTWPRFAALAAVRPVVVTLHSLRDEPVTRTVRFKVLAGAALRCFAHVICVGREVEQHALALGARPSRTSTIAPFVPPPATTSVHGFAEPELQRFLKDHHPTISANAFRLDEFDGADKYGLDLCVRLCQELKPQYPRIGFIVAVADDSQPDGLERLHRSIRDAGLEQHFLVLTGPREFWPILKASTLFVRPTNTDSYGISVAEALHLGVPVVASDVCARPPGTVVFRNRDFSQFLEQCRRILRDNPGSRSSRIPDADASTVVDRIVEVYTSVARADALRLRPRPLKEEDASAQA